MQNIFLLALVVAVVAVVPIDAADDMATFGLRGADQRLKRRERRTRDGARALDNGKISNDIQAMFFGFEGEAGAGDSTPMSMSLPAGDAA